MLGPIIAAVEAEIAYIHTRTTTKEIQLYRGQFAGETSGLFLYRFDLDQSFQLTDDVRFRMFVGERPIEGNIVSLEQGKLTIAVGDDLGPVISYCRLVVDDAWILECLQDQLHKLHNYRQDMVDGLLGMAELPAIIAPYHDPELNDSQNRAVGLALGSPLSFIWGPPGSGKTKTLARFVRAEVERGRKVLVLGPTNIAVDTVIHQILLLCRDHPKYRRGLVLRPGAIAHQELLQYLNIVDPYRAQDFINRHQPLNLQDVKGVFGLIQRLKLLAPEGFVELALDNCKVMGTTVHRYAIGNLPVSDFDTIVVDEASMVNLPYVVLAAARTGKLVIAGDFRQLPPISMARDDAVVAWMGCDAFTSSRVMDRVDAGETPANLAILDTQYRMRPQIAGLVNHTMYQDHPLKTDPSVERRATVGPVPRHQLLYVDTHVFSPAAEDERRSKKNMVHAQLITGLVAHLHPAVGTLGVVTPYAAQAILLRSMMRRSLGRHGLPVSTAHKFQGNECPVILLDLPDSPGSRLGHFMTSTTTSEDGARLLNVGVSRAKETLIVVANFDYLRQKAPRQAIVRKLLDYLEEHGVSLDVGSLLEGTH